MIIKRKDTSVIILLSLFFLIFGFSKSNAQTGTYQKTDKLGGTCTISVEMQGKKVSADVFAWWNTASGRHGVFSGSGVLKGQAVVLNSSDGTGCHLKLNFKQGKLDVTFTDCMEENLPEDFSGTLIKITDITPGEYSVKSAKSFFYSSPNIHHRKKSYLLKNNRVNIDIENIRSNGWVFVNYTNPSGKTTSGYFRLEDLNRR
jgi:hypothetical protein